MYITKLCSICSATIKVNTPIWNCNPVSEHFFTQTHSRGEKPRIVVPCFMCCNRPAFMWSGGQKKKKCHWCHTCNWWLSRITLQKINNDEDDEDDKPLRVPIVLRGTHARLVTGLWRARSERISVILMTAVYFACLPGTKWDGCLFCLIGPPDWSQLNQPIISINYSDDTSAKKKKIENEQKLLFGMWSRWLEFC